MDKAPKSEIEKIQILKENLKEIFDLSKYSTFGHGTNKVQAEKILKTGLESATDSLDETTLVLDDTKGSLDRILDWPHRNYKYIVIVMVPNAPTGMGGFRYFDSVFDELPENRKSDIGAGREFRKEYYIQPQFIKGYIDVDSLSLIKNELYDPEAKVDVKEVPEGGPRPRTPEEKEKHKIKDDPDSDWE